MKIIAVANQKGGVGKTTTTFTLGVALNRIFVQNRIRRKVLLVDLDPQGSLTKLLWDEQPEITINELFAAEPVTNIDLPLRTRYKQLDGIASLISLATTDFYGNTLIKGTERLRNYLQTLGDIYEICLIDCPPSLGTLTVNGLIAADYLLLPVTLDALSLLGVHDFERILQLVQKHGYGIQLLGYVPVMLDKRYKTHRIGIEQLEKAYGDKILTEFTIPTNAPIPTAAMYKRSVIEYRSDSPATHQYMKLAYYVCEKVLGFDAS
jgi:chromosome partitioning protein